MLPTDNAEDRESLLERMEEAADRGLDPAEWRALLQDLALRPDAAELLAQALRSTALAERLRRAYDEAPVPPELADAIKATLTNAWRTPAARTGTRRLSGDEIDLVAAAGQFVSPDDPADDDQN